MIFARSRIEVDAAPVGPNAPPPPPKVSLAEGLAAAEGPTAPAESPTRRPTAPAGRKSPLAGTTVRPSRTHAPSRHLPRRRLAAALALVAILLLPATAAAAEPPIPITAFTAIPSSTQAGGHPNVGVFFSFGNRDTAPSPCACNDIENALIHLPTGLIGNPHATPQCNVAEFAVDNCPVDSQVGLAQVNISATPGFASGFFSPLFNLVPPPGDAAVLAFKSGLLDSPTLEVFSARTGSDYGLDVDATNITHVFPLRNFKQVVWGLPADPFHDVERFSRGQPPRLLLFGESRNFCGPSGAHEDPAALELCSVLRESGVAGVPVPSNSPLVPFTQNPTTCDVPLSSTLELTSYAGPVSQADYPWPATTDCDQLSFNPSQAIEPTTKAADSPSGAEFRLTVPQFESPSVPSPSELRAVTVTLPRGFSIAPNVMNGKTTCSDAEARFGTTEEAHCPEDAKIGTLTVETPVLPGPLPGAAYLGEPLPGNRYRMFLVFDGFGVHVKLAGSVVPDPLTGQIHISFQNLPQAPFETFNMHVFGSERGVLATPTRCGTYPVESLFTPWDSKLPSQTSTQFFTIDEGPSGRPCPGPTLPFSPGFKAASAASTAATHTSFSLDLTREDGDQNLAGLTVTTPPGFSATLRGVPYCPASALGQLADPLYSGAAELASPVCGPSQVGTVTAAVGAGNHPLYLPGKVYLAGPYQGAPLSLEVVIPAVAGPYDLGNVAVRAAIHVNPETAQITTVSDPLPQIVAGIPIRTRQILVNLDRKNFALNPTNCDPFSVDATLVGDEGAHADLSQHFQVANCASLPFKPKLSLKLSGGLNRLGHPAIHSVLTTKPGEANTAMVSVALPRGEILDNAHIEGPCTRTELNAGHCPPTSVLGHAKAITPLLDQPLEGPVYLTTGFGHQLPDLIADLKGQIHIQLDGKVDTVNGGSLRTTFQTVPDAPVSTFTLDLAGGAKGLIQNSAGLCGAHKKATVQMNGQNGKRISGEVPLQTACGKAAKHKRHVHRAVRANREGGR